MKYTQYESKSIVKFVYTENGQTKITFCDLNGKKIKPSVTKLLNHNFEKIQEYNDEEEEALK